MNDIVVSDALNDTVVFDALNDTVVIDEICHQDKVVQLFVP